MKIRSLLFSALICLCLLTGPASVTAGDLPGTVVLTNENGLIDNLIAAGYGSGSVYEVLVALKDYSGGAISDALLATLRGNPAGSEIFTAKLEYFAGLNNPVCLNIDGTVSVNGIFGRDYYKKTGYSTYPPGMPPKGNELFTTADDAAHYIDAGTSGSSPGGSNYHYLATLIIWGSPCTYALSTSACTFEASGASGSFTVTPSESSCSWTAISNDAWITVTAGDAGSGTGVVSYSVEVNPEAGSRTGTLTIAGQTFTVTQSGTAPSCTYTLSSTAESVGSAAASGSVTVTALDSSCAWTAVSNDSWITVTSGDAGAGTGTVSYSIAMNNMLAARTGTLTIAGQTFTITQSGAPACTYSFSPSAVSLDASSAQGSFNVTPSAGICTWTAESNASWITVTAGSSGTGTGAVSYSIAANTAADSRTGTLTIGGRTFTVIQSGTAPSMDPVQKAYIGYYQRPADPAGQIWWAGYLASHGGSLAAIIEAFANSNESRNLYGTIDSSNIASVIDAIYQALFNRAADTAGRDWYVAEFNKGAFTAATIMLNVLYGAQNDDLVTLNNKLITANLFTKTIDPELDSSSFRATYAGDTDAVAARAFLGLVTSAASSVPSQSEIAEYIKSYIADPGDAILAP